MKKIIASIIVASGVTLSTWAADVTVKISDVHLCCENCVKGAQAAVGKVAGVTADVDQGAGTVSLIGPDTATLQKAADSLVAAGYFGTSGDPSVKISDNTGAKGEKVAALQVDGVHLCCGKCVTAVNGALGSVAGVTANTAAKGATSFTVTGDFNDKDVFAALQKIGLAGTVGK